MPISATGVQARPHGPASLGSRDETVERRRERPGGALAKPTAKLTSRKAAALSGPIKLQKNVDFFRRKADFL
jgi:hypothetical protein